MDTATMYNATLELDTPARDVEGAPGDELLAKYSDYHTVITRSLLGRAELILSFPAAGLWQATATARALAADLPVTRLTVERSVDFDKRSEAEVPSRLLSVTEAAEQLGLTRAGVQRRIDAGSLAAVKVGSTWAIPAGAIAS